MDKLLSCPFCGSKSVIADHREGTYSAACSDCGAEGPSHFGSTHVCDIDSEEAKAITAWNTRHTPEGWQSIYTAPEGMEILVYAPMDGVVSSIYKHGCWQKLSIVYGKGLDNEPTHWMPLPATPKRGVSPTSSKTTTPP